MFTCTAFGAKLKVSFIIFTSLLFFLKKSLRIYRFVESVQFKKYLESFGFQAVAEVDVNSEFVDARRRLRDTRQHHRHLHLRPQAHIVAQIFQRLSQAIIE